MPAAAKTEPKLESVPVTVPEQPEPVRIVEAVVETPKVDQFSRIEDKTARIEEKFARSEERMMRLESALEKATLRLEGASQEMNLQGVKDDIVRMREQVSRKPGAATILVVALIAALFGAVVSFALLRYGIPGVLPGLVR